MNSTGIKTAVCVSAMVAGAVVKVQATGNADKPNVIFIVTDDQLFNSLGCYGGNTLTPHIDSLAENGIRFTNANAASTVCSPARYAILTGQHPARCKEREFLRKMPEGKPLQIENFVSLEKNRLNIGGVLQDNGYATGFVGKSHIAEHFLAKDWEEQGLKPYSQKADPKDSEVNAKMRHNHRVLADRMKVYGFDYVDAYYVANMRELYNEALNVHNVEWTAQAAVNFIDQNKDKPFFLYYSTTAHHGPKPDKYKNGQFPFSLDSDIGMTSAGYFSDGFDVMEDRQSIKKRVKKAGYPSRSAAYTWIDCSIGAILKQLRKHNIEENTIIVYLSDHGSERGQKATAFEGGLRIPMLLQWKKKIKKGFVTDQMIQSLDLAPTVFEACGVKAPNNMLLEGKSLMPVFEGSKEELHQCIYAEIGYARTIKTPKWKYIAVRYPEKIEKKIAKGGQFRSYNGEPLDLPYLVKNGHLGYNSSKMNVENYFTKDQLYCMEKDLLEANNLFGQYPELEEKLKKALSKKLVEFDRPFGEFN